MPSDLILFHAVKAKMRLDNGSRKHQSLAKEFPLAKLSGPISTELTEIWEAKFCGSEKVGKSQSLPLYEKVATLVIMFAT